VLDDALAAFAREAARDWPQLRIPAEDFVEHVRARLPADDPEGALAEIRAADLLLAFACLRGDEAAWRELDRACLSKIQEWVARIDRSPTFADEVRQRLAEKLASDGKGPGKLAQYTGKGPLWAWLRVVAIREAHTIVRGGKKAVDADDVPLRAGGLDPELELLKRRSADTFKKAFAEVLASLPDDDKSVLKLHYLDGLTIDEVGKAFRVSRASAARLIAAARDRIVKRVERTLRDQLGANAPGAHSLLALVQSQFDLSVARHFRGLPDDD
jgi:RNA polymerase sigma-70 factor (ECF subfamily)